MARLLVVSSESTLPSNPYATGPGLVVEISREDYHRYNLHRSCPAHEFGELELTWGEVRILRRQRKIGQNLEASPIRAQTTINLIREGWAFPTFKFEILLKLNEDVLGAYIGEELNEYARAY